MTVYAFDPLADPRWPELLARHPHASIFHTPGWLRSLQRTYRFTPMGFTTSPPNGELRNALVFCAVRSWITGHRLVSLPFSDHCDPLVDSAAELQALCLHVEQYRVNARWKYAELRPAKCVLAAPQPFGGAEQFYLHRLDLRPSADDLWRGFHRDSIQRRIDKARRERLEYEEGASEALLGKLYHLLGLTRRRHRVPLQPLAWFRNLVDGLGPALCIRIVSRNGQPAAGVLTLTHGTTVVYKYGGSDVRYNALGGMPLLFWAVIEDAKRRGAEELDLGRSDQDNSGLIVFKDRWGARRSTLTYWRSPVHAPQGLSSGRLAVARRVFDRLPTPLRQATASVIYRHLA